MAKKGVKRDGSKSTAIQEYLNENPGASSKTVKADLAAQGLNVSEGLVNKVKYSKPRSGGGGGAKKSAARKGTQRKSAGRPPAGGVNMSDAIRDYMGDNPGATRPEIRDALQAQGVPVSNSLVNAVFMREKKRGGAPAKSKAKRRPKARRATAPARRAPAVATGAAPAGGQLSADELINAKGIVEQFGGIDKVRTALSVLEQLQD